MEMKVILNFQRNKEIHFEKQKKVKKKARKNENKNNQLKI